MTVYVYEGKLRAKAPLSPARAKMMAFIAVEVGTERGFPTKQRIIEYMGWKNENSAQDVLNYLVGAGWLRRTGGEVERLPSGKLQLRPSRYEVIV